jgi:pimeloyl-ACP methyl ester carboxylesterase
MSKPFTAPRGTTKLCGEWWQGSGPVVVLLHAGVADRRSWYQVANQISEHACVVAYDRRGFGESRPGSEPFSHLDDLIAVLEYLEVDEAWLVGSSAGGRLALDAALEVSERVTGLILIAPAVSGAPSPDADDLEPHLVWLDSQIDHQVDIGNLDEANRFETWLWLDGPSQPEGRVRGVTRELFLEMNRIILANDLHETVTHEVNAWARLEEVDVSTTVACGSLDVGFLIARSKLLAARIPKATYLDLEGVAHLPYVERPQLVAELVIHALTQGLQL